MNKQKRSIGSRIAALPDCLALPAIILVTLIILAVMIRCAVWANEREDAIIQVQKVNQSSGIHRR